MDALGRDIVLVETVGSGQVEIDIVRVSDTTIVIMNPGAGDEKTREFPLEGKCAGA